MKILMTVYNSLDTDSRVQRSSSSLTEVGDIELIGIDKDFKIPNVKSQIIQLHSSNNMMRYFEFAFIIKKLIRKKTFDVFYANDFYCAMLVPWVRHIKKNVKVVYDAHELYIPQPNKPLNKRFKFFYNKEKKAIHDADIVVCANDERSEIMFDHYNLKQKPLVIRNISHLPINEDGDPNVYEIKTKDFFATSEMTLVYAGVLSSSRKIESLIDIANNHKNVKLLIVGEGPYRKFLEKKAKNILGERAMFTGSIPYAFLGSILRKCDIGYLYYPIDILNNICCAPNKIYEYASVNLPMIANENPTVKKIFQENGVGVASENLDEAFEQIVSNLDKYKRNCEQFNRVNRWAYEKQKLVSEVRGLIPNEYDE